EVYAGQTMRFRCRKVFARPVDLEHRVSELSILSKRDIDRAFERKDLDVARRRGLRSNLDSGASQECYRRQNTEAVSENIHSLISPDLSLDVSGRILPDVNMYSSLAARSRVGRYCDWPSVAISSRIPLVITPVARSSAPSVNICLRSCFPSSSM